MEENLHTEQTLELDEEQLTAITGGSSPSDPLFAKNTYSMNNRLRNGSNQEASMMATSLQGRIRENAEAQKVFEVNKGWAKTNLLSNFKIKGKK